MKNIKTFANIKRIALIAASPFIAASAFAIPTTYYDVDFSSPTHTVGSAPTVDAGSDTPSSINFGTPTVQDSFAALSGESLVFNTTGNSPFYYYDQIGFNLGNGSNRYKVSFDLSTDNYVNTGSLNHFVLLFDTPQIRNIYFENDGTISYLNPGVGSGDIGSFTDNSLLSMIIDIDLISSSWDILMNNNLLYSGFFDTSGADIFNMRFSFGGIGWSTTYHDSVGIDNIKVTNGVSVSVPEPSSLILLACGFLAVFSTRKKG